MEEITSKKWVAREVDAERVERIQQNFHVSQLVATMLSMRPLRTDDEISRFLQPRMADCHNPFLFVDMQKAKERILQAIENQEKIYIYGDYDADGITSTAILMRAIGSLGGDVNYYIPNRFTEGYGPNREAFSKIHALGCTLLITVDNGIAGIEEMQHAKKLGMDVILTDHHALPDEIPDVYALIHPKNPSDHYPFNELCGAGVALKLAHALHGKMQDAWLELATIGTICDLMPLIDENRVIVKNGLRRMMMTKLVGLREMFKACKVELYTIEADTIGFIIGPRLNAIGRLLHAKDAVELLITDDEAYAKELVKKLESFNQQRKEIVEKIVCEAMMQAKQQMENPDTHFLVLANQAWNPGVVGIVASRIVSMFHRPTIILGGGEDGCLKGSGRSIESYHIVEALKQVDSFLLHYGGHEMAAGLTLDEGNLAAFREALNQVARAELDADDLIPHLYIDYFGKIDEITVEHIQELERLAPFGSGNPKPIVVLKNVASKEVRTMGTEKQHLRLVVHSNNRELTCVGFHFGTWASCLEKEAYVSVAGRLSLNEWKDKITPQLHIEDITIPTKKNITVLSTDTVTRLNMHTEQTLWVGKNKHQLEQIPVDFSQPQHMIFSTEGDAILKQRDFISSLVIAGELDGNKAFSQFSHVRTIFIYPFWQAELNDNKIVREDFVKLYKKLRALHVISDRATLQAVGKEVNMSQNHINFYLKVFFDLNFATIDDGKIIMNENPRKRELTESKTYQKRMNRLQVLESYARYSSEDWTRWIGQLGF